MERSRLFFLGSWMSNARPGKPLRDPSWGLVWSNPGMSDSQLIQAALCSTRPGPVAQACAEFGIERVRAELEVVAGVVTPWALQLLQGMLQSFTDGTRYEPPRAPVAPLRDPAWDLVGAGEEVIAGELAKRVLAQGRIAAMVRAGEELGWASMELSWRALAYQVKRAHRRAMPADLAVAIEQAWQEAQRARPGGVPADRTVPEIVAAVAAEHGIVYKQTGLDVLGDKITELAGDDVPAFDSTQKLLLRLAQKGIITKDIMTVVHDEHLQARAGREEL